MQIREDLLKPKMTADDLAALSETVQRLSLQRGEVVLEPGRAIESLYLIRSGAVEVTAPDGRRLMELGEGEAFGVRAMLGDGIAPNLVTALDDLELYLLARNEFARLREAYGEFADFFVPMRPGETSRRPGRSPRPRSCRCRFEACWSGSRSPSSAERRCARRPGLCAGTTYPAFR